MTPAAQKQPQRQSEESKPAGAHPKNGDGSSPHKGESGSSSSSTKRRKVGTACIYCRRSHMTCDEGRPCKRCIKRDIGHLCHDESTSRGSAGHASSSSSNKFLGPNLAPSASTNPSSLWGLGSGSVLGGAGFLGLGGGNGEGMGASGDVAGGNEYNILSEFLESLDGSAFPTPPPDAAPGAYGSSLKGFNTKTEKFFLTAADQNDGTRDERLGKVIQAKYDAGLLRPYNHVNGYARLNRWMEQNASQASRRRILKPLSVFRPAFRAVAQSLTNVDLIYIEEAFERLLLDYDRVFSTQGIPACLWRRTGEIYKGNKEFAELVGVGIEALREGRCTIYELMEEESAVNYWEKYGAVSFDPGQKAVLTSCVLKTRAKTSSTESSSSEETDVRHIPCCFSFTIRRDAWSIPCLIVGNFLPLKQ
ncbi:hypothetical protein FA10DRAFT_227813 [Acaromyces ingoldii]|uniref:Zn(2)-C6 fungal-type domain-containing protein n=1 Tax=Acaromyces ingoldii TaxID=215250 RepID=A0A316YS22_9BASI|nr:hypothetical protein FA10DRAFT_227813 [Acaromyces ingoldii]PWN92360.1 hypothetical protein FA10DRAFT_227813 [Acaromyces ingoldii]